MAAVHGHHGPTLGFSLLRAGFWVGLEEPGCVWVTGKEPSLWLQVDQAAKATTVWTTYCVPGAIPAGPGRSTPIFLATTLHAAKFQSPFY